MSFSDKLNEYMEKYSLTTVQLTNESGLSKSTISRFRNSKQEPPAESDTLRRLSMGIATLINGNGNEIFNALSKELKAQPQESEQLSNNLNKLISTLDINASDLSRYLNYDASYLSRIRSGQRKPAEISEFCEGVAAFTVKHYSDRVSALAMLMNCSEDDINSEAMLRTALMKWLCRSTPHQEHSVKKFLEEVDRFDLNEYIRAINFDKIKTPTIPFDIRIGSKTYYKLSGFMKAELDWTKTTVLSPSSESVIMYSDMPMEEMAKDKEFTKKIIGGMAMMLKKGLHLNVIHNIDRSFSEMMLGLEGWIPLYMTGQVSPYYFKGKRDAVFHHFIRVSGAAALTGEAISGKHENGRYYLTRSKDEIAYFRRRAEDMLSSADSLMDIYREDMSESFGLFLESDYYGKKHRFRNILSAPPIYTISEDLLLRILDDNNINGKERENILAHCRKEREKFLKASMASFFNDEILMPAEEEFDSYPSALPLADIFTKKEIYYTYDTYCEHIALTQRFAEECESYQCTIAQGQPFRNIQIRIAEGEYAIISKNTSPTIHFVVRHQKLRQAIEHMVFTIA